MGGAGSSKWVSIGTAPRDGTLVLARLRASEQGPEEVDAVRWAVSARSGEGGWVANDSDPFARVAYCDGELSGWMPLPTQAPGAAPVRTAVGDGEVEVDEAGGAGI